MFLLFESNEQKIFTLCYVSKHAAIATSLTLWRPLLPYRYSYKASCARPGCTERQSARMSKITNDGLTRPGTGCFIDGNSGNQRVKPTNRLIFDKVKAFNTDCGIFGPTCRHDDQYYRHGLASHIVWVCACVNCNVAVGYWKQRAKDMATSRP